MANLLVPDLIAYQGAGTTYAGPTVGPLQNAGLVNTGTSGGGPMDVFSVFDSLTVTGDGLGNAAARGPGNGLSSPGHKIQVSGVTNRTATTQNLSIPGTAGLGQRRRPDAARQYGGPRCGPDRLDLVAQCGKEVGCRSRINPPWPKYPRGDPPDPGTEQKPRPRRRVSGIFVRRPASRGLAAER